MRQKIGIAGVGILALWGIAACDKGDGNGIGDTDPGKPKSTIEVRVFERKGLDSGSRPLQKASVRLYRHEYNREHNLDPLEEKVTDTTGEVVFRDLESRRYYLKTVHDQYEEKLDEGTPPEHQTLVIRVYY